MVVRYRTRDGEVARSNLERGYFASAPTRRSIPPGSVNEQAAYVNELRS